MNKRLRAVVLLCALLLTPGRVSAGAGTARPIADALLQLGDMPDGYAVEPQNAAEGAGVVCGVSIAIGSNPRADVAYSSGGALGYIVFNTVAALPKGEAKRRLDKLATAVKRGCAPMDDATVTPLKFAKLCDQSVALRRSGTVTGNVVLFRCGDNFGAISGGGFLGPPPEFSQIAQKAAKRLRSMR